MQADKLYSSQALKYYVENKLTAGLHTFAGTKAVVTVHVCHFLMRAAAAAAAVAFNGPLTRSGNIPFPIAYT